MSAPGPGLFGKVPSAPDFIRANLPETFVAPWHRWLVRGLARSRGIHGDAWLDLYLEAPLWRFHVRGEARDLGWLGLLMPSVDAVDRCFPLTIACACAGWRPVSGVAAASVWLDDVEAIARSSLADDVAVDAVIAELAARGMPSWPTWPAADPAVGEAAYATALDVVLGGASVWGIFWTAGSPRVAPCCTCIAEPLAPDLVGFLIDGRRRATECTR